MRPLEWITLAAVFLAGAFAVSPLVVPVAAVALMLDHVFGTAHRLRRARSGPLSSKNTAYLALGALGWLMAAWVVYIAGTFARGIV